MGNGEFMGWDIEYQNNIGIMRVRAFGRMNLEQLRQMGSEAILQAAEFDTYRSLIDLRQIVPELSMAEIAHLPEQLAAAGMRRVSKVALVSPADPLLEKSIRLFAALCVKLGYMMQVFLDPALAVVWLSGISLENHGQKSVLSPFGQIFDKMLSPAVWRSKK